MDVVLDVSPPALRSLTIDGRLSFSNDVDLELTTEWIVVRGELAIGSEASPHMRNATITFTDNVKNEEVIEGMGDRGISVAGGTLNLHGDRAHPWTKLARTAEAGSDSIEILNAAQWRVSDELVLASTDFDPRLRDASNTSYYVDDDALWVKVVVADNGGGRGRGRGGFGGGTSVQVSR